MGERNHGPEEEEGLVEFSVPEGTSYKEALELMKQKGIRPFSVEEYKQLMAKTNKESFLPSESDDRFGFRPGVKVDIDGDEPPEKK